VNMLSVLVSTDEPMVEIGVKALLGSDPEINLLEVCRSTLNCYRPQAARNRMSSCAD